MSKKAVVSVSVDYFWSLSILSLFFSGVHVVSCKGSLMCPVHQTSISGLLRGDPCCIKKWQTKVVKSRALQVKKKIKETDQVIKFIYGVKNIYP